MARRNESLFEVSGSHDQNGRHAHMVKSFPEILLLQNLKCY